MANKSPKATELEFVPSLKFFKEQCIFEDMDAGVIRRKFISPAAVRQAFTGEATDSGWLADGVERWGMTASGQWALITIPAQVHSLLIEKDKGKAQLYKVPLPRFAFFGHGSTYYVWAMREQNTLASAEIYAAPLPNVHQDGHICFGRNTPPKCTGLSIATAWDLFITSPFNGDLAGQKHTKHNDIRALLFDLAKAKAKAYPLKELAKIRGQRASTVEAMIRELTQ
jgi:hypothetical protein